ncbi:MAG: 16S rRNA (uracil(1498)-N(3))-methyltransferase [Pseudomonadales bacterium]|nr:16S rRNA (uracil(1498)-N(3))-methyltransferase [Pseudomonadales bacterium]
MRVPRIHVALPLAVGPVSLEGDAAHHLARVLRRRVGDPVELFDGEGRIATGRVEALDGRRCVVTIETVGDGAGEESPLHVHLGIALLRGERMDIALQKACELGVGRISLLTSERVELKLDARRLDNRLRHYRSVVVHAAQQSGRSRVPELDPPMTLEDFARASDPAALRLVMDPEGDALPRRVPTPTSVVLATGPEGGFAPEDLRVLARGAFQRMRLGPRVLRAETAPLVGLSVLQWCWGDLGGEP